MAASKNYKTRVNKAKKLNKRRFPRWTKFAVIGLVAVVGIVVIFNTFAANSMPVNTTKVINGGSLSDENSSSSMARSPITLEACRMSDTPGEGEANRIYVGAKPVISSYVANKLNAVWDKYYPEYHIDGQNVTYAADYQMPEHVYYDASFIVDRDKPTDTQEQYRDFLLPSEGYPQYYSGKFWETFAPGQPPAFASRYFESPGKAVKKFWDNATIYTRNASYIERNSNNDRQKPNSPFPASSNINTTNESSSSSSKSSSQSSSSSTGNVSRFKPSNTSSNGTTQSSSATNNSSNKSTTPSNNTRQSNTNTSTQQSSPNDVSKLNSILGTVTSITNPQLNLRPGTLPGRTSWSYLEGPVARYNDAKCPGGKEGGFSCGNNPSSYDVVNNPNPFIKFNVSWIGGRNTSVVNDNGKRLVEHDVKIVRFKDLPKCGNNPLQAQNQIDSKASFSQVQYQNYEKAFNQIKAAGIDVGVAGPGQDKMAEIFLNNGISPLASLGSQYWTGLPPKGPDSPQTGYGDQRLAEPIPN